MSEKRSLPGEATRIVVPIVILAVGIGGFIALGGKKPPESQPPEDAGPPLVETVNVIENDGPMNIRVDGRVVPYREITISAEVGGRVKFKAEECRAGHFVESGVTLIEIDPSDYQFEFERLSSEVAQAVSQLTELQVDIDNTADQIKLAEEQLQLEKNELERSRSLYERRLIPDNDYETALNNKLRVDRELYDLRSRARQLDASVARLEAAKKRAETLRDKAELDIQRCAIKAPCDGVVISDPVEQGAYVAKGMALLAFEDTSKVEVECHLRMKQLYWIWDQARSTGSDLPTTAPSSRSAYELPKTDVTVTYELNNREYTWKGRLDRYDGLGLDNATRTVPCRIVVPDPVRVKNEQADGGSPVGSFYPGQLPSGPPALVRGMYVTLQIHATPGRNLMRVPETAVQPGNEIWRVVGGKLDMVDVDVAAVEIDMMLRRGVLDDDGLKEAIFKPNVLTPDLEAELRADPLLTRQQKEELFKHVVYRDGVLRNQAFENAIYVVPAEGEDLLPGDAVIVSPLAGAEDGMAVTRGDGAAATSKATSASREAAHQ
jgi:multidrug efflux pump subunit AcrA (membrane-fusion protein)